VIGDGSGSSDRPDDHGDLAEFETGDESGEPSTAHGLVDLLVRRLGESADESVVTLPTTDGDKQFDRQAISSAINDAMRTAAEDARNAAKAGTARNLPLHLIEDAAKQLSRARVAYEKVSTHKDFDADAMRSELDKATRALEALTLTVNG
jgi:hypothetical protein